jgi:hypothetical protein
MALHSLQNVCGQSGDNYFETEGVLLLTLMTEAIALGYHLATKFVDDQLKELFLF